MVDVNKEQNNLINRTMSNRWTLVLYDSILFLIDSLLIFVLYHGIDLAQYGYFSHVIPGIVLVLGFRFGFGVYRQIWRYGDVAAYMRLIIADFLAGCLYLVADRVIAYFFGYIHLSVIGTIAFVSINLLMAIIIRLIYRYAYLYNNCGTSLGVLLIFLLRLVGVTDINQKEDIVINKIRVAIVGAGSRGAELVESYLKTSKSPYHPVLFIDNNKTKAGRKIQNIPVFDAADFNADFVRKYGIQEIIIALQHTSFERKLELFQYYQDLGCKVRVYDTPNLNDSAKPQIRNFDIEELLFRKPVLMKTPETLAYYKDKTVLITGGGGSIGSEICRRLAAMDVNRLIILDIAENGSYDIQQELRIAYQGKVDIKVEIASVCDISALRRVFNEYHPDIVVMAAAHKHVPLMEKNCIEAVKNNVFGTLNTINVAEEYNTQRVILVSTDKAVNPTNVMGATKRLCEMIVQVYSEKASPTTYSMTRFGNVLGSAGSVIPLFKKQIAQGGPVTVTDYRVTRYFMTIPEASQLVLESGAMAKNGDLFVLDMGEPVEIMTLAKNMIKLSGVPGIEIVETGLRPGEKLYEELLVSYDTMEKTSNELIFIEHESPISYQEMEDKLKKLTDAIKSDSDENVKTALRTAVPTYKPTL